MMTNSSANITSPPNCFMNLSNGLNLSSSSFGGNFSSVSGSDVGSRLGTGSGILGIT